MVGIVNQTNVWSTFNVSAGQLLEIPAGRHTNLLYNMYKHALSAPA
jgi:hypothetical protein